MRKGRGAGGRAEGSSDLHKVVDGLEHDQLVVVLVHAREEVERGVPAREG